MSPVLGACLAGCARAPVALDSPEPAARAGAIALAVRQRDLSAVPGLVELLSSDDSASRLLAILALERLTGSTLGYDATAPEPDRAEAVERWRTWSPERAAPRPIP